MQRFVSIAILLNWFAILLFLGTTGLPMGQAPNGLFALTISMFDALAAGTAVADLIWPMVSITTISLMVAVLWAGMAVLFCAADGSDRTDQDFVIISSFGFCLLVFATLLLFSTAVGDVKVGALAALMSLTTTLSIVACKVCAAQGKETEVSARMADANVSLRRANFMASQSALLANFGARQSCFVPKRPFQP